MSTDPSAPALPPNARIEGLSFDDAGASLRMTLRDGAEPRDVAASAVTTLAGARIRHTSTSTTRASEGGINFGKLAITLSTGLPTGAIKGKSAEKTVVGEELHQALAMRASGVAEVWYLLADSFNFRRALGPDATYSSQMNLKLFVKRLAAFAPAATQDAYVKAVVAGGQLPPPVDSLLEFLRSV